MKYQVFRQRIHKKHQALFSLKNNIHDSSAAIVIGTLRVKQRNAFLDFSRYTEQLLFSDLRAVVMTLSKY